VSHDPVPCNLLWAKSRIPIAGFARYGCPFCGREQWFAFIDEPPAVECRGDTMRRS
jgi:hypothetical protein